MRMKKTGIKFTALAVAVVLLAPASLLAQKEDKEERKELKEKKEVQQIIITRKSGKDEKVVVEINDDKVTINGKPLEEYKNKDGEISIKLNKLKDMEFLTRIPNVNGNWNFNTNEDHYKILSEDANHAMLGVITEKTEQGAAVSDVTKESAAEKIGLKEGDIITKVDDKKIESPDDLSATIKSHKPGDKVVVTYLRDKKEQKATAELTKWKGINMFGSTSPGHNFKLDLEKMDFDREIPRVMTIPRTPGGEGQTWSWSGRTPKLGLSVQDTDDGKGVKVIEVDEESNAAKAGIKKDDLVTEVDGKAVNSTDDIVKIIKESKDKISVMMKLLRNGKTQNIEVKMPRKIKTADL
jgi:serine protease Do